MPLDLFAEEQQGVSNVPQGTSKGPLDLYAGEEIPVQQIQSQQEPTFWQKLSGTTPSEKAIFPAVLTGAAEFGQGIESAPYRIAKAIGASPEVLSKLPQPTNIDVAKGFQMQKNPLTEAIAGAIQYSPYALATGGAGLMGDILGGGAYGATQSEKPISGAATGAGLGLIGGGLGLATKTATPLARNLYNRVLARHFAPTLAESIGETLTPAIDQDAVKAINNQAYNIAKTNESFAEDKERAAWDVATQSAKKADQSGVKYDNSSYIDSLQKEHDKLWQQSKEQAPYSAANKDPLQRLEGYMQSQHGSFEDAINHGKALNVDYKNEMTPGISPPFETINYAKANLEKNLLNNIEDAGLQDTLGNDLQAARQATAEKRNTFYTLIKPSGKQAQSSFGNFLANENTTRAPIQDATPFVYDYIPTAKQDGTQGMEQFSKMIGDENFAKNVLKQNIFNRVTLPSGDIDTNAFLKKYNTLSDSQQSYLFNDSEKQQFDALAKILQKDPNALSPDKLGTIKTMIASGIGAGAGALVGHPALGAVAAPLIAPMVEKGISGYLTRYAAQPEMRQAIMNYLQGGQGAGGALTGGVTNAITGVGKVLPTLTLPLANFLSRG